MGHWYKDAECPLFVKEDEEPSSANQSGDGPAASPPPVFPRGGQYVIRLTPTKSLTLEHLSRLEEA